ncbi:MAG TPA: hypothetical protein PK867_15260, partial [Pirellulales bacterium]|nr:hypothetical protein [Pirellulales bacterium]
MTRPSRPPRGLSQEKGQNGFKIVLTLFPTRREAHDQNGNAQWLLTQTVYDGAGRASVVTDEYQQGTTAPIWGTRYTFDTSGRVIKTEGLKGVQITFNGTPNAYVSVLTSAGTVVSTTTTTYDALGRIASSTDQYGRQTLNTYDSVGNLVEARTQNYDQNGTLVWRVTRTVYDKYGRAVVATDPFLISADGNETVLTPVIMGTQTVYDDQGRVIETDRLQGVTVSLSNGETSVSTAGTVVSVSKTIYNSKGQIQETIDPAGRTVDFEYDDLGQQTAVVDSPLLATDVGLTGYVAGTIVRLRTEKTYDALGREATETTNIREIIAPNGTVTTDYSADRATTYSYDQLGNLVLTTLPAPGGTGGSTSPTISTTFDGLKQKTSDTNEMGQTRTYSYNADGQLSTVQLPAVPDPQNGNAPTTPTFQYAYDASGNQQFPASMPCGADGRPTAL